MAYYPNPAYGYTPGAPQGTHRWVGNQFVMSDLPPLPPPAVVVPPPPPPPPPPITPADVVQRVVNPGGLGGTGGSGGPGGGPGGIGGASGGGQDRTNSGYQGVYSQSPVGLESRFGETGGLIGTGAGSLSGIPGVGTVLGFGGGMLDAARINGTLDQYGMPGHVNPWGAGFAQALAGIGIPFTDLNLARAFGVPTAQQRLDAIIAGAPPGLYNEPPGGYGQIAANTPLGPATVGEQAGSRYPAGFADWSADLARSAAVTSPVEDPNAPMPTSSFYAGLFGPAVAPTTLTAAPPGSETITGSVSDKGAFDPGGWGEALGGKGGSDPGSTGGASDKGADASKGGDVSGSSGWGGDKFYRGGLVGAPPGRYAAGGAVRAGSRMPGHYYPDVMMTPPRDYMSDTERHSLGSAGQPDANGQLSPREQAIQDFMGELFRAREREVFPEQLARGGVVAPAAPDANITPAQFGLLRGVDPPGPDDQIGALQTGEGVLTKRAMAAYPGLLDAANAGKLPKRAIGLLAVVPAKPRRR